MNELEAYKLEGLFDLSQGMMIMTIPHPLDFGMHWLFS